MSLRAQMTRGGAVLAVGKVGEQGAAFVRNLILARLLGPADWGIAAVLAMTAQLLAMLSDVAADQLLIQSEQGDDVELQKTAQTFEAARCLISAALLVILAEPVAILVKEPDATWAFRFLAIVPALRGFLHLDIKRLQRKMEFGKWAISNVVPQVVTAAAAWPLAQVIESYWAVVWLLIAQQAFVVVASHLFAERPYRLGWNRDRVRTLVTFGWPLLFNGLLIFACFQGVRLIVAVWYDQVDLGVYAVASLLAFNAGAVVLGVSNPLLLPMMARVQNDESRFARRAIMSSDILTMFGSGLAVGFIVAGPPLIVILYGSAYAEGAVYIGLLGAAQAIRLLRVGPAITSTARGDTKVPLYQNLVRLLGTVGALVLALEGQELWTLAAAGTVAEVVAFATGMTCLVVRQRLAFTWFVRPIALFTLLCVAAVGVQRLASGWPAWLAIIVGTVMTLVSMGLIVISSPSLRTELSRFLQARQGLPAVERGTP